MKWLALLLSKNRRVPLAYYVVTGTDPLALVQQKMPNPPADAWKLVIHPLHETRESIEVPVLVEDPEWGEPQTRSSKGLSERRRVG